MQPTATYSPEDDKIRIYPVTRFDKETYDRVKEAGFSWAPKQECFYAVWTPTREDIAEELCGEIEDEDKSLTERAEERAERFEDYSDKRESEAVRAKASVDKLADAIPFGQPILVGHHSERRARKDAERIKSGMSKAVKLWKTSVYWTDRAAGAISHAKYKERPDVRARRIKKLEAEQRKSKKQFDHFTKLLAWWGKEGRSVEQVKAFCNMVDQFCPVALADGKKTSGWSALEYGEATVEEIRQQRLASIPAMIEHYGRWVEHLDNRIAYEKAMLGESGGTVADKKGPEKGGAVRCWASPGYGGRGWSYVVKVNKVSVTVYDNFGNGGQNFTRTIPFDKLTAIMTAAEVTQARDDGRLIETQDKIGFYLNSDPLPKTREKETPSETAAQFDAMESTLKAGVKVVSAPNLFPTPADVAHQVVELAKIEPGMTVLEPSAGTGNLVAAVLDVCTDAKIDAIEVNHSVGSILRNRFPGVSVTCMDYLETVANLDDGYDRVVMNPPFDADISHVRKALGMLKPSGILVAIVANGPRQQRELQPLADAWIELPRDTFAGTSVSSAIIVIKN